MEGSLTSRISSDLNAATSQSSERPVTPRPLTPVLLLLALYLM